jgi:hypothetical protein
MTIWALEGETGTPLGIYPKTYYGKIVKAAFSTKTWEEIQSTNANGAYGVKALNLSNLNGRAQDQLFITTPIPSTFWLLGSALVAFVGIRRRMS